MLFMRTGSRDMETKKHPSNDRQFLRETEEMPGLSLREAPAARERGAAMARSSFGIRNRDGASSDLMNSRATASIAASGGDLPRRQPVTCS